MGRPDEGDGRIAADDERHHCERDGPDVAVEGVVDRGPDARTGEIAGEAQIGHEKECREENPRVAAARVEVGGDGEHGPSRRSQSRTLPFAAPDAEVVSLITHTAPA